MREYRFFTAELKESDLGVDLSLSGGIESDIADQLAKVLRVKKGDIVVLLAGDGVAAGGPFFEYVYEVENAHKKEITLKFLEKKENKNECGKRVHLVLCMPNKPDKLSLILQKAVELGVRRVILVYGDNSQMKHEIKEERLKRVMKEAAEQSERAFVPEVRLEGTLAEFLGGAEAAVRGDVLVAMERSDAPALTDLPIDKINQEIYLLVGPEGGFSAREKSLVEKQGLTVFSLGKRILRMETAAILALGVLTMRD